MSKLFVRHRQHVGQGAGRPRFAIVAVEGVDLKVYRTRVRRAELEKISAEIGAEIVYLPRGEYADNPESQGDTGSGRRHRHRRNEEED
jgi:hypothetical protein